MTDASAAIRSVSVNVARSVPEEATAIGVPVATKGSVPRQLGLSRKALAANGFEGKTGQVLAVPTADGVAVAIGVGEPGSIDANGLRRAGAAFARAAAKHAHLATTLVEAAGDDTDAASAAQAVVEGVLLASYRYVGLKNQPESGPALGTKLTELTVVAGGKKATPAADGARDGATIAAATAFARELANTPPTYLNARDIADRAVALAADAGLEVEVYNKDQLETLGCGGILGVNRGSTEPPRMIKLTYVPKTDSGRPAKATGHLAMVGKGIMYDSGGISLKPSDGFHQVMKMDMSGAAAVLASMSALAALGCRARVTAWLMCTDNMPSGSALKLGDVLTMRNGKTVEIHNTDAEGRLVLADGLSLAVEEEPDAIVDIATLTGSALGALGEEVAALLGTDQPWIDAVKAASDRVDEPTWQLPLERDRYRKKLDSVVADMRNIGGPYGGTITASIFLSEFTDDVPYAHLDIAGPMKVDADSGIHSKGSTGFGTRLLIEVARSFTPPSS